jgi:hypothetical protein
MSITIPLVSRDAGYGRQSMGTTSRRPIAQSRTTLWIVVAMLGVGAILVTMLPPASSYGGSMAAPAWVTSL